MCGFHFYRPRMNLRTSCLLVVSCLPASSAMGAIVYSELEHIDSAYMTSLEALPGNMGFANFQGTNQSGVNFMITLFFNVDTELDTTPTSYPEGSNRFSMYNGALGIYVFNMDSELQEQVRYLTPDVDTIGSSLLQFTEVDQNAYSGLYEDNIQASALLGANLASFFYYDNNHNGADTTGILNTSGGDHLTLAAAGFPFVVKTPEESGFQFTPSGSLYGPNSISGTMNSAGLLSAVPEPSTAMLFGGVASLAFLRRRRSIA